jgi:site-specific DNA-methyltransferase (adenine-specific)
MIPIGNGQIALGDCLDVMRSIPTGSVDMILCDLPYGTTACSWDSVISFEPLWSEYWRVAKPNAAVVLTASQPFTSALIMSQIDRFKYCLVWEKSSATGVLDCKFRPLKAHEDILVFSCAGCSNGSKPPMKYFPQMTLGRPYIAKTNKTIMKKSLSRSNAVRTDTYNEGVRYPRSVLLFPNQRGLHPTQKPVALFEYLIRTYTNEGETVLDNCIGSGTTAIAAENTGRRWIGIERDPTYFGLACDRIARHVIGVG